MLMLILVLRKIIHFEENPYDRYIFNKKCKDGSQMTIALHADDLKITNLHNENLDEFFEHIKRNCKEIKTVRGQILDHVEMTFNFSVAGEMKITIENRVYEILTNYRMTQMTSTPAYSTSEMLRKYSVKSPCGSIATQLRCCIFPSE
jgi:hypothetical protein